MFWEEFMLRFFRCKHCGKIIVMVNERDVPTICCGEPMAELVASSTDAAVEKHVPVVSVLDNVVRVKVGAVEHPMVAEHYIEWICLQTNLGHQIKYLAPGQKAEAEFLLAEGEEIVATYAYCNLHSLWVAE